MVLALSLTPACVVAQAPSVAEVSQQLGMDVTSLTYEERAVFCSDLKGVSDALNDLAPLKIDSATVLRGSDLSFVQGECLLGLNYGIDESVLFETLQETVSAEAGYPVPHSVIQSLYSQSSGLSLLKDAMRKAIINDPSFRQFIAVPFVVVEARYRIDGRYMDDFEFRLTREALAP